MRKIFEKNKITGTDIITEIELGVNACLLVLFYKYIKSDITVKI